VDNNDLSKLKFDTTRQIVTTTRGELLPIKDHRGWKYVNYEGRKIGLSKISAIQNDPVFEYVFGYGHRDNPFIAMDYWILRHRLKRKVTPQEYLNT